MKLKQSRCQQCGQLIYLIRFGGERFGRVPLKWKWVKDYGDPRRWRCEANGRAHMPGGRMLETKQ